MSNIVKHNTASQLAIHEDQTFFTDIQLSTLSQIGLNGAGNGDLGVFFHQVQRTGLDPFAKQIYMINRQGKWTIQTGIDGFRLIARRSIDAARGTLGYEDTQWADQNGNWHDVWLSTEPPAAARVTVLRDGSRYPAIAMFHEYAGKKRDGKLNQMWATKGAHMIAKCAEALALRKAFPQDLSGLYTSDEMDQADNVQMQATRQDVTVPSQHAPESPQPAQNQSDRLMDHIGQMNPQAEPQQSQQMSPQQEPRHRAEGEIRADYDVMRELPNAWEGVSELFMESQAAGYAALTDELNQWAIANAELHQQQLNQPQSDRQPAPAMSAENVQEALDAEVVA